MVARGRKAQKWDGCCDSDYTSLANAFATDETRQSSSFVVLFYLILAETQCVFGDTICIYCLRVKHADFFKVSPGLG